MIANALHDYSYAFIPIQEGTNSNVLVYSNSTFIEAAPIEAKPKDPATYLPHAVPETEAQEEEGNGIEGRYTIRHLK